MTEVLCYVCNTQPKKYKCPTCAIPYCSLVCFKEHKSTHPDGGNAPNTSLQNVPPPVVELPQPPPPAPVPKYLKQTVDFSVIASNPKFQELLKLHPALLPSLQRVYASTIEPDPDSQLHTNEGGFRGRGARGRGRGYGRAGRGGGGGRFGGNHGPPKWTPKKGDNDAMRLLKRFRDGKEKGEEKEAMAAFVTFVEESLESAKEGKEAEKT